jgi:nucleoside 2-deoxyribosyltransferase
MIKVYIASPYTKGDVAVNVKNQIDMADVLMNGGFAPFVPLYSHFQHMAHPRPYQDWIKIDLEWVEVCDVLLRLDGDSPGADGEIEFAESLGKPVFYNMKDLMEYKADFYRNKKK